MSTISKVRICNLALRKIGQATISSLAQSGSKEAATCDLLYDQTVLETLADHHWAFARKRVTLALVEEDPTDNWSYSYALPTDMVRSRALERVSGTAEIPYELEGDLLYTDEEEAVLIYTGSVTDPLKFSVGFVRVLVLRLAMELATSIFDSETMTVDLYKLYQVELKLAAGQDSSQQTPRPMAPDSYLLGRS